MSVEVQTSHALDLPQVFGRYLLLSRLSRGGMGEIFLARHGLAGFEKLCVIKKVLPHLAEDEGFISRFIDEAQVTIKLQHANVAQVFEVGRVGAEYFLCMEYVEGRDLRRVIRVLRENRQRLHVHQALFVAREMTAGLAYAHRRTDGSGAPLNLVHCDVSPPNVLISFEGEVKLIDFGIAKSRLRAAVTDPNLGFGKFGYMAPEQLVRGGTIDHRTDIYASGVVLFELLTGTRMYRPGDTPDYQVLAQMVSRGQHPLPSHLDPVLAPYDELVSRALRPDPGHRYQSAAEFRDAIQAALVHVNPTMTHDHLGGFVRMLFGDEVAAARQALAVAESVDMSDWADQFTSASAGTVTFAIGEPARHSATGTQVIPRQVNGSSDGGNRWPVRAGIAGAVVAVAVVVALVRGGDHTPVASAEPVAAAPPVLLVSDASPGPTIDVAPAEGVGASSGEAAEAATAADQLAPTSTEPPRAARKKRRPARPKMRAASGPRKLAEAKPAAPSADRVQAKLRTATREYKAFKKKFGARLESDYTEVMTYAQFATSADKLRVLDRKLDTFLKKMRTTQSGG